MSARASGAESAGAPARALRLWLVNPYGPIPGEGWRDYRFTLLGRALAARGHAVTWWTSSFSHHFKRQRSDGWERREVVPGFDLQLVPSPAYRAHIGPGRIRRDLAFGVRAYRHGRTLPAPDLVVSADSPLAFGYAGPRLAEALGVPYVVDVMDLWPELFDLALPARVRVLGRTLFAPVYADRARRWRRAAAVVALSEWYREVAAGVRGASATRTFYNGIDVGAFRAAARVAAASGHPALERARRVPGVVSAIFAGTLGENYDVPTMLGAVARLRAEGAPVRLLVAGDGPLRPRVEAAAAASVDVVYLGKLPPDVLGAVYGEADVALAAYGPQSNVGMPDKFYDYTAAGLPVVNSLPGELAGHVAREGVGRQYRAGDAADLAAQIGALARDPAARAAAAGRAAALADRFDAVVQFRAYAEFLEGLVAVPSVPGPHPRPALVGAGR